MDCNTARMLATFFGRRGAELAAEDAAALDAHLARCPGCASAIRSERAFDDRITRAMLGVTVPANLKSKLLDSAAARSASWYRQKAYVFAGIAAAVLLSVGAIVAWKIDSARALDPLQIVAEEDEKTQNPRQYVEGLLESQNLSFDPERAFEMRMLSSVGMERFQGREVPVLRFWNKSKNASAKVYVLRDTQFNWKNLPQDGSAIPSVYGHQVVLVPHARRGDIAYVVVFTGEGLELFLENRSSL